MKFAIQVNCSPYQAQGADSAHRFICAALEKGHQIYRVFFYFDGVYNALCHATPPEDEKPILDRWTRLATEHGVDLVVCVSAAQRRGLLDSVEANRRGVESGLASGFRISGLGQWVEAAIKADRVLIFGG